MNVTGVLVGSGTDVAEAMLMHPKIHSCTTSVGELRHFFLDEHVHAALLVDRGRLVAVVERSDLPVHLGDDLPAALVGSLAGRTVRPNAPLELVVQVMRTQGRRRLVVTDAEGRLQGLLCLRASGDGLCSDADVALRAA
jgi:CBS domain-containing protein